MSESKSPVVCRVVALEGKKIVDRFPLEFSLRAAEARREMLASKEQARAEEDGAAATKPLTFKVFHA